jgi:hypothetical protein
MVSARMDSPGAGRTTERRVFIPGWRTLGTKSQLAMTIEEITGVDLAILEFQRAPTEASVARRMSWAARRQTRRIEDEAYSLMGLFQVNMPTIYGEGRTAFRRLQEEILRTSVDHTLFAWTNFSTQRDDARIFAYSSQQFADVGDMESLPLGDYRKAFEAFANVTVIDTSQSDWDVKDKVCTLI